MKYNDTIQRFILENTDLRGELVYLGDSLNAIMQQHEYPPFIRQCLGEVLLASVLLRAIIKVKGVLTIQLQSEGAIRLLVAKCDNNYHMRGLAQWDEKAPESAFQHAIGAGNLIVTVMPDNRVEPFQSIVPLNKKTVASALEDYFIQSEQLTTKLWLTVNEQQAVGILLQKMPTSMPKETSTAKWFDLSETDLLVKIFEEDVVRLFQSEVVRFRCSCSVLKMADQVRLLGEKEARIILLTNRSVTVTCEFCNQQHDFSKADIEQIFAGKFTGH